MKDPVEQKAGKTKGGNEQSIPDYAFPTHRSSSKAPPLRRALRERSNEFGVPGKALLPPLPCDGHAGQTDQTPDLQRP
ncbi:hypothetical protein GGQ65_004136 [Rhizobium fabae]|uniref:Uncharacterized protein n=1 Tax=Rhizobium fabae TaxID=573179 RepID=A0A7W6B707_9HYPH|nr:hypothetical protein [Rhizobium fabae]